MRADKKAMEKVINVELKRLGKSPVIKAKIPGSSGIFKRITRRVRKRRETM